MLFWLFLFHCWVLSGLIAKDIFQSVLLNVYGSDGSLDKSEKTISNLLVPAGPIYLFVVLLFYSVS